jgi:hypothetical protein
MIDGRSPAAFAVFASAAKQSSRSGAKHVERLVVSFGPLAGGSPAASYFLCCAAKKVTQENAPHIPALRVPESPACRAGGEELAPLLFYFRCERGSDTFAALFRPADSGFGGSEGEKSKTRLLLLVSSRRYAVAGSGKPASQCLSRLSRASP